MKINGKNLLTGKNTKQSKKKPVLEKTFEKKVRKILQDTPGVYIFDKIGTRGDPDIIGCARGKFFGWELKRSSKARVAAMQIHKLNRIVGAGGIGEIVYPENFEEKLKELLS
jgi:hypothetical protein